MEIKHVQKPVDNYGEWLSHSGTFIETGSCYGRSIALALSAGYMKVCSVEAKDEYYQHCRNLFKQLPDVHLYLGKSVDRLEEMLENAGGKGVIFLDAHVSGEASAGYQDWVEKQGESDYDQHKCLMKELDIIKEDGGDYVIIIDDQNGWNEHSQEYIDKLQAINPEYKFEWWDEVMGTNYYVMKMLIAKP